MVGSSDRTLIDPDQCHTHHAHEHLHFIQKPKVAHEWVLNEDMGARYQHLQCSAHCQHGQLIALLSFRIEDIPIGILHTPQRRSGVCDGKRRTRRCKPVGVRRCNCFRRPEVIVGVKVMTGVDENVSRLSNASVCLPGPGKLTSPTRGVARERLDQAESLKSIPHCSCRTLAAAGSSCAGRRCLCRCGSDIRRCCTGCRARRCIGSLMALT